MILKFSFAERHKKRKALFPLNHLAKAKQKKHPSEKIQMGVSAQEVK